ncbi:sigma-70 family RNA polymerase sigma factor [Streptacidiphilus jiangxiensis]|uniref:RNA polymerase sigma factor, sigma-70 family n=1 Tax=Streptacidiphilus jiangxiensis TaxID=235985 RepID=A0A1H7P5H6_STRJI|nr:sigma-70 family RNA polymerase sigma factor [Streptacidiphilus jiangxiensis]SEL30856.1 RNA polymerase sigma factor, sigma-70 family [Streptacidiphilus jiangxiensis]
MSEISPPGPADPALVCAAQHGDARALDTLVSDHLPLIYNIVGRALDAPDEADDVVQEIMLQVVRDVRQLRDPGAFRSWLVAIALREVRRHWRVRRGGPPTAGLEALAGTGALADPRADFAELTVTTLSLSGQRREAVEATRWLDADERQLLSLWWMEVAGRLTRAELAGAMDLPLPQAAVRVQRTKARLELARAIVRALRAEPRCAELRETLRGWNGQPGGLWRKRIARHLRDCPACGAAPLDLVAADRLLADLALVSVPPVLLGLVASNLAGLGGGGTGATSVAPTFSTASTSGAGRGAARGTARVGRRAARAGRVAGRAARVGGVTTGKVTLLGAVALVSVLAVGYAFGLPGRHGAPPVRAAATSAGAAVGATPTVSSSAAKPSPTPSATTKAATVVDTRPPVRAAFYYPWYPENFTGSGSHYTPSAGRYSVDAPATVDRQIEDMQYAGLQAGISSWWGAGRREDRRLPLLLAEGARLGFSWTVYYEQEAYSDPSVAQIRSDLLYLRRYSGERAWLHVDGRPVIFVYAAGGDGCGMAARWAQANRTAGYYVVLKVFPGYRSCAEQPQGWHQYTDSLDVQPGYSAVLSPGFWKNDEATPRVPRDLARFRRDAVTVATSGAPFQLVVTYNEWGEGTAVESSTSWPSSSGHGAYLDILHQVFSAHPR